MANLIELARQRNQNTYNPAIQQGLVMGAGNLGGNSGDVAMPSSVQSEQNVGGALGGLGYLGHKAGLGFLSWFEGVVDFTVGGIADFFGADDFAEEVIANDWTNYNAADEWFKPDDGWRVAGDVAQGIGNSLPSLGIQIGVGIATGGLSTAAQIGIGTASTFFSAGLSAAGRNVSEAYNETGKLTGEEWGYGAASGAMEGAIEAFMDDIVGLGPAKIAKGMQTGKILGNLGKKLTTKTFGKTMALNLGKSFAGEAMEEALSAHLTPYIKRITYDPAAKEASAQEILYSAFIGGLSGLVMGAGTTHVTNSRSSLRGKSIIERGKAESVIEASEKLAELKYGEKGLDAFSNVEAALGELKSEMGKTGGVINTRKQRILLARLDQANTAALVEPQLWKVATNIVYNTNALADTINQYYSKLDGTKISVTAEQLREGVDFSSAKSFQKSIIKALKENSALRTLAIAQVAGEMVMDTQAFGDAVSDGQVDAETLSRQSFDSFKAQATAEQRAKLSEALGIDVDSATLEQFKSAVLLNSELRGKVQAEKEAQGISRDNAFTSLPQDVNELPEGWGRYTLDDGTDIGIKRMGDKFRLYSFNSGIDETTGRSRVGASAELSADELNEMIRAGMQEDADPESINENVDDIRAEVDINAEQKNAPEGARMARKGLDGKSKNWYNKGTPYSQYNTLVMQWAFSSKTQPGDTKTLYDAANGVWNLLVADSSDERCHIAYSSKQHDDIHKVTEEVKNESNRTEQRTDQSLHQSLVEYENVRRRSRNGDLHGGDTGTNGQSNRDDSAKQRSERSGSNKLHRQSNKGRKAISSTSSKSESKASSEGSQSSAEKLRGKLEEIRNGAWLRENVAEYASLPANEQLRMRSIAVTAKSQGLSDADICSVVRVAARSGLNISFERAMLVFKHKDGSLDIADGLYKNGTIYINPESERAIPSLLSHELVHSLFGKRAKRLLSLAYKSMSKADKQDIKADYEIDDEGNSEYREELAAHYAERIMGSESSLAYLWSEEPTLKENILGFFKSAESDYSADEKLSTSARKFRREYRKLFKQLEASAGMAAFVSGESRKSFGGERAATADKLKLETAEKMLADGVDSETVRQETGWFKGYDGKWRFEIDDSDAEFSSNRTMMMPLHQLMKHDALYGAYPFLKKTFVAFNAELEPGVSGAYNHEANGILLNNIYDFELLKGTVIHEVQHAIQHFEGFSTGSSIEFWNRKLAEVDKDIEKELSSIAKEIDRLGKTNGYNEFMDGLIEDAWTQKITVEEMDQQELDWIKNNAPEIAELKQKMNDLQKQRLLNSERDAKEMYKNTAGEIEARDAANRAELTADQRKQKRPDIDRSDVVFAEDSYSMSFDTESKENDSKKIIRIIRNNISSISTDFKFDVKYSTEAEKYNRKYDYVLKVFEEQGNLATNHTIGKVELVKSGAKSTIAHGYGHTKLAAVSAIKAVIENGDIISYIPNYENSGIDRYVIAAMGKIDGIPAYIGAVVKSYPNQKSNSKFYLHEAEIIKADSPHTTAPQLSVDTVGESTSNDSILENSDFVNSSDQKNSSGENKGGRMARRSAKDIGYLRAVERGDMRNAQRIIDEAAIEWGARMNGTRPKVLYHGTPYFGFTEVDFTKSEDGFSFWATDNEKVADEYSLSDDPGKLAHREIGKKDSSTGDESGIYSLFYRKNNEFVVNCERSMWNRIPVPSLCRADIGKATATTRELAAWAKEHGYDSIRFTQVYDHYNNSEKMLSGNVYAFFNEDIVRSADPVTYDDNGDVIPVSERFKTRERSDLRYAKRSGRTASITQENIKELRDIGRKSVNAFTSEDIKKAEPWARKFYAELGTKSPFFRAWFGDWRAYDTGLAEATPISVKANINRENRTINNSDAKWNIQITKDTIEDSIHYAKTNNDTPYIERLLTNIDKVLEKAILFDTTVSSKNKANKKGSTQFMHYLYSVIEYNGAPFLAKFTVEEYDTDGKHRAYNVQRIKMSALSRAQYSQMKSAYRGKYASNADGISIADLHALVKTYDKEFSPKDVNPILLNEDGTPKVFYHGTNEQFTVFDPAEMSHREGSYFFAENKEDAAAYGDNIFEVYLSAENLANYDEQPREFYELKDKRAQVEWLKERGYDGWYADMDSGGWGEVSVFDNTQIKSATDNIGTFDGRNPDIRYAKPKSKSSDKVTVSKGQRAAERANVSGERVFSKTSVQSALKSITGFDKMPKELREELVNDLWKGFNIQLYDENYLRYASLMAERIKADILQESSFELTADEERKLEGQIKTALDTMISEAKLSARTKMNKQLKEENQRQLEDAEKQNIRLREELYNTRSSFKVMHEISKVAGRMRELKVGKYKNAAEGQSENFAGLLSKLGKVINNSNTLNVSGTRRIMGDLAKWYMDNKKTLFEYESDEKPGLWNQDIYNMMVELGEEKADTIASELESNTFETIRLKESDLSEYLKAGTRKNINKHEALAKGEKVILTSDEDIANYISRSINGEQLSTAGYGKVNNRLAEDVALYSSNKIQINNNYFELVANDIHHAYEEHHNPKETGDIPLSKSDFLNIPNYLDSYDELLYAITYNSGNTHICVSKKISDGRILLIETVSKSRGSVQLKNVIGVSESKYISDYQQKYKRDSSNTGGGESLNISPRDETISNNSIPQNAQSVKRTVKKVSKGSYTIDELKQIYDVMSYFYNFVDGYGKIWRNGKRVEALPIAKRYVAIAKENDELRRDRFMFNIFKKYGNKFADPAALMRYMDCYQDGFFSDSLTMLRHALLDAELEERRILHDYDAFCEKNKKYIQDAEASLLNFDGTKLSKMQLISIYMSLKRSHAQAGLLESGYLFDDSKGVRHTVSGILFKPDSNPSAEEIKQAALDRVRDIKKMLSATDLEYIEILERAYNVDARELKAKRDLQRMGYTNALSDYYVPIRRIVSEKGIDDTPAYDEYETLNKSSFNRDTVKGAKQQLYIESADIVFHRHISAVCQYACISPATETYSILFNLDVSDHINASETIAKATYNIWNINGKPGAAHGGNAYFSQLIKDARGVKSSDSWALIGSLRGAIAKSQLGFNPKVLLTQFSSMFASSSILDVDCLIRGGIAVSSADLDKYCPLAELRNSDNTAAYASAVLDTAGRKVKHGISSVGDALMVPIGKVDRFVISRLFGACQAQVEKDSRGKLKIGTEENKVEAGKLLETVIFETQQNTIATERSAATRSGNEIMKALTMYKSDAIKVFGRVIDGLGEVTMLKRRIKRANTAGNTELAGELKVKLKSASRKLRKSLIALISSAIFMTLVARFFLHIYNRDQDNEDKTVGKFVAETVGNMMGGLPILSDIYSRFADGYELDNYAYSAANDMLDSVAGLFGAVGDAFDKQDGSREKTNLALRKAIYSFGQFTGLPIRNMYNVFFGLTNRFFPKIGYKIDGLFYQKNYQSDFYKAIEEGDDQKARFVLDMLMGERLSSDIDESTFNELLSLNKQGYKILPRSMPKSISTDTGDIELTAEQKSEMQKIYSASKDAISRLFATREYASMSSSDRETAVSYISSLYYSDACNSVLGTDKNSRQLLISRSIGADKLAILAIKTRGLESDLDKPGNSIAGSRRQKVISAISSISGLSCEQKLLLICSKGYSLSDGDIRGLSAERAKKLLLRHILSMKLSVAERAEIAKMCGFEVKNGKVVMKSV